MDITFTFPSAVTIDGFRVKSEDESTYENYIFKGFEFQTSLDKQTWSTAYSGEGRAVACCDWQTFSFGMATSKYFRLLMNGNQQGNYLALKKLEFHFALSTGQ